MFFLFPFNRQNRKTIEADRPSRRLFFLFSKKIKLHSYNWCSADYCEGGASKGTCHLKSWDTSKPGEIWGCSGAGQLWKVSFVFFSLSRENDDRKSGFSLLRARYCIFFFRCCCCCSTVTAAADFHRLVKGNMNGKGARRRISNLKTFGKNPEKKTVWNDVLDYQTRRPPSALQRPLRWPWGRRGLPHLQKAELVEWEAGGARRGLLEDGRG